MNHAILFFLANIFSKSASQSNQWYNWFEQNEGKRAIKNGILPTLTCPRGYYRQFKEVSHEPGGINMDGCMKCPVGVFGNTTDLMSPTCTAPCPIGTYNDEEGAVSIEHCKPCPVGTYGDEEGLINSMCSGYCEDHNKLEREEQYYSIRTGLTSSDREYIYSND